jgi:hypothetical protein
VGHDCLTPPYVDTKIKTQEVDDVQTVIRLCKFSEDDWRPLPANHIFLPTGYTLYTMILDADDGETMFAFTHVLREAKLDVHVEKFEKFVKVGDSGLEPFTQRGQNPAHIHLAIMKDRNQFGRWQGGMGNVRPWYWLKDNGFQLRQMARVPSPNDYMGGYMNREGY